MLVQSEPYYLRTAFPALDNSNKVICQELNFAKSHFEDREAFIKIAQKLGADITKVDTALAEAAAAQKKFSEEIRAIGQEGLAAIEKDPEKFGVVLFGRPYNSFASVANKGIPAKFASRDITIIPFDMLPYWNEKLAADDNMYWAMGQIILKGARFVKKHPQLYGAYVSNFSCGPDSFLISYFREIMGRKPSLTLELDSHTADAGLETRIEAFLDIVRYYREIQKSRRKTSSLKNSFRPASIAEREGITGVQTSNGRWLPLTDKGVRLLIPAMSRFGTPLLEKAFKRTGIKAEVLQPADEEVLKLGRGHASCKECLPLQTTLGSLLNYVNKRDHDDVLLYFMASSGGPCRLGQYHVYTKRIIEKLKIPDVANFTPTSENGYSLLGDSFLRAAWRAIVIGDLFDEMWSTVLAGAEDRELGLAVFHEEYQAIMNLVDRRWPVLAAQLSKSAARLGEIKLQKPFEQIPKISLVGEIYVRHDPISLQNIIERFADRGIIIRTAPVSEYIKFVDWLIKNNIQNVRPKGFAIRQYFKKYFDWAIRKRLAPSGLFYYDGTRAPVEPVLEAGQKYISKHLTVETIVTVGSAFHDILHPSCGIISIGPFGCMPSRVAEAVLSEKFTTTEKKAMYTNGSDPELMPILSKNRKLPFLAIETDGNPFPQLIEARLEAFCIQAERLNEIMLNGH